MCSLYSRRIARGIMAVVILYSAVPVALTQEQPGAPAPKKARAELSPPKYGAPTAYYVCIFAYDAVPHAPRTSHTFATFVKADGRNFEAHTISWLPQSNEVRVLRRFAEPGVNRDSRRRFVEVREPCLGLRECLGARLTGWHPRPQVDERRPHLLLGDLVA